MLGSHLKWRAKKVQLCNHLGNIERLKWFAVRVNFTNMIELQV